MTREEFIAAIESMGAVEPAHQYHKTRTWFRLNELDVIIMPDEVSANVSPQKISDWQTEKTYPYAESLLLIKALVIGKQS